MAVKQEKEDGFSPAVSKVKRPGSGLAPPAAAAQALRASDAAASASGTPPPAPPAGSTAPSAAGCSSAGRAGQPAYPLALFPQQSPDWWQPEHDVKFAEILFQAGERQHNFYDGLYAETSTQRLFPHVPLKDWLSLKGFIQSAGD